MEKLRHKYKNLIKSFEAFGRSSQLYQNPPVQASQAEQEAYVASVVKHFELLYETLWKFLKLYLNIKFDADITGSKTIFRACYHYRLVEAAELEQLLTMVDIRNATAHVYNEQEAQRLSSLIVGYYEVIKKVIQGIKI